MSGNDNGGQKPQVTQIEMEMHADTIRKALPGFLLLQGSNALLLFKKFEELKAAGFSEAQALEIVCKRPLYE